MDVCPEYKSTLKADLWYETGVSSDPFRYPHSPEKWSCPQNLFTFELMCMCVTGVSSQTLRRRERYALAPRGQSDLKVCDFVAALWGIPIQHLICSENELKKRGMQQTKQTPFSSCSQ